MHPQTAKENAVASAPSLRPDEPLIPSSVLDPPSQRFYVSSFYLALTAWRLYDYFKLISEGTDSLWLFMKWVAIDGVFFYSLPELKIPWLTWSFTATTVVFLLHAIGTAVLMFRLPVQPRNFPQLRASKRLIEAYSQIPLESWTFALIKMLYDREIAVSERRIKPESLLHNPSLIVGKQIVNILPEGLVAIRPCGQPVPCSH